MLAEELTLGMRVRYPRTGTTGIILRIEQVRGEVFAELDSTNLLYRIDSLIPASGPEKTKKTIVDDAKKVIEREKAFASGTRYYRTRGKLLTRVAKGEVNPPAQSLVSFVYSNHYLHEPVQQFRLADV